MKKINNLVIDIHSKWKYHLGTSYELIRVLLEDENNFVYHLGCLGRLKKCDIKLQSKTIEWLDCKLCSIRLFNMVKHVYKSKNYKFVKLEYPEKKINLSNLNNENWFNFKHYNYDVGRAVKSSLVSAFRNPEILYEKCSDLIKDMMVDCVSFYEKINKYINENKIDKVWFFNGRFAYVSAVKSVCESNGIDYYIHERGSDVDKYMLYYNSLPHNIEENNKRIEEYYYKDVNKAILNAREFYENRRQGFVKNWVSFTSRQNEDYTRSNSTDIIYSLFTSSEDEFVSVSEEYVNYLFKNQIEGLIYIINYFGNKEGVKLIIKNHPNINGMVSSYKSKFLGIQLELAKKFKNIEVYEPNSPISTYSVLDKSDVIVVFNSTVGMEAAYMRKPVIALSPSQYKDSMSVYAPMSLGELEELLSYGQLEPIDSDYPIKYGNYLNTFGTKFKYFQPVNLYNGLYK